MTLPFFSPTIFQTFSLLRTFARSLVDKQTFLNTETSGSLSSLTIKASFPRGSQPHRCLRDPIGLTLNAGSSILTVLHRRQRTALILQSSRFTFYLVTSFRCGERASNSKPALSNVMKLASLSLVSHSFLSPPNLHIKFP